MGFRRGRDLHPSGRKSLWFPRTKALGFMASDDPTTENRPRRFLPLLLLLFVGSGSAAMIYEVVWLQLLQLVIGSTAASLGVLLGTFMGGMCLGSLLLPRMVSIRWHPLRVYALLELGIGAIGLLVLLWDAFDRSVVLALCPPRLDGDLAPSGRRWNLCLLPANPPDGGDASGDRAMGRVRPGWGLVAGLLLRRQHRRGRLRLPAGGVLSAPVPRHGHCDLGGLRL